MSVLALFFVILGSAIIVTRAPLIFAPETARRLVLRIFGTDRRMRMFGIFVAFLGALLVWVGGSEPGPVAQIVFYLGFFMVLMAALAMIPLPGPSRKLATRVWERFAPRTLRIIGALAVLFGALLVIYGLSL